MPIGAAATSVVPWGALAALILFMLFSLWLGLNAQRAVARSSFLKGYFLGNRGLGVWAMALTATVQSGGTFMGFPSLVYSHGWVVALWIGSYMVVPLCSLGILGKRVAQMSRRTGAITVPDLIRQRFESPAAGVIASMLIILFLSFNMVGQFKAGALIMKAVLPGATGVAALSEEAAAGSDTAYYFGLAAFAAIVIAYTVIGGFLAAVWTDLFQSVMMFFGVLVMLPLALAQAGGLEHATRVAVANTGPTYALGPGFGRDFHPLGLAISFFFVWTFSGMSAPATLVREMACQSTGTIRRSIFVLSVYNMFIYLPLVMICICARAIMPNLAASDEVIPRMALAVAPSFVAGLILAAPFGAVMSTVSTFLVVVASGLIHDVYQRLIRPQASERELKWASYIGTVVLGIAVAAAAINPPNYLQAIIVFTGTGAAATFMAPAVLGCYWRRATAAGAMAGMLAGAATMVGLYTVGWTNSRPWFAELWKSLGMVVADIGQKTSFRPYYLLGIDPFLWGMAAAFAAALITSLLTRPPSEALVSRLFDDTSEASGAVAQAVS